MRPDNLKLFHEARTPRMSRAASAPGAAITYHRRPRSRGRWVLFGAGMALAALVYVVRSV